MSQGLHPRVTLLVTPRRQHQPLTRELFPIPQGQLKARRSVFNPPHVHLGLQFYAS